MLPLYLNSLVLFLITGKERRKDKIYKWWTNRFVRYLKYTHKWNDVLTPSHPEEGKNIKTPLVVLLNFKKTYILLKLRGKKWQKYVK